MHLLHHGEFFQAVSFTGTPGGLFAWESHSCAAYFGVHTTLEILPDSHPASIEIDQMAALMASALTAGEARRAEIALRNYLDSHRRLQTPTRSEGLGLMPCVDCSGGRISSGASRSKEIAPDLLAQCAWAKS